MRAPRGRVPYLLMARFTFCTSSAATCTPCRCCSMCCWWWWWWGCGWCGWCVWCACVCAWCRRLARRGSAPTDSSVSGVASASEPSDDASRPRPPPPLRESSASSAPCSSAAYCDSRKELHDESRLVRLGGVGACLPRRLVERLICTARDSPPLPPPPPPPLPLPLAPPPFLSDICGVPPHDPPSCSCFSTSSVMELSWNMCSSAWCMSRKVGRSAGLHCQQPRISSYTAAGQPGGHSMR